MRQPTAEELVGDMRAEIERVAIAMFDAENRVDGNQVVGWEDQPPEYKQRIRAMALAAILELYRSRGYPADN